MKILILTCLFVFHCAFAFSQDYAIINPNRKLIYHQGSGYIPEPKPYECVSEYPCMQIDSARTIGSNVIYYHYRILAFSSGTKCTTSYEAIPNWTGPVTVVKSNGENIFLNKNNDSIRIKTKAILNEKWHLLDYANGDYFEAEVTGIANASILTLNVTDNLKTITINLKNQNGDLLPHSINGREIILTENYGMFLTFNFYHFPSKPDNLILYGIDNPLLGVKIITAKDVFNFDVGDEFHIDDANSYVPYYGHFKKERRRILQKNISADENVLTYSIERSIYHQFFHYQDPSQNYTTKTIETITEEYILSNHVTINSIPSRLIKQGHMTTFNCLAKSDFNNRAMKTVDDNHLFTSENDTCFGQALISTAGIHSYIDGLGEYYEGDESLSQHHRRLVYYKKGSETWGTPIDFDVLLSVTSKNNNQIASAVSPNPFSEQTVLKIKNENKQTYQVILTDVFGKIVKEYSFNQEELTIQNDGSLKGMYFYKLFNSQQDEVGSGKLIAY